MLCHGAQMQSGCPPEEGCPYLSHKLHTTVCHFARMVYITKVVVLLVSHHKQPQLRLFSFTFVLVVVFDGGGGLLNGSLSLV